MAKTQDVAHNANTWRWRNARDDHQMSDLTQFLMKILRGTTQRPHIQRRGLSGTHGPTSTNSCQNDAAHAHVAQWS